MSIEDNKWLSCAMPSSSDDPCIMTHNLNSYREHSVNRIANISCKRFHSALALILSIVGRARARERERERSLCIAIQWPVSSMLDSSTCCHGRQLLLLMNVSRVLRKMHHLDAGRIEFFFFYE